MSTFRSTEVSACKQHFVNQEMFVFRGDRCTIDSRATGTAGISVHSDTLGWYALAEDRVDASC